VLRVDGQDAGYFELGWAKNEEGVISSVEILYFGLFPGYIGFRLGPWLLHQALKLVRNRQPQARIWVHTCSWDHPKALSTYEKAGFKWYKEEIEPVTIPSWYCGPGSPTFMPSGTNSQ
jgi:GNAT superfamily N-acetyltransferase